MIILASPAEILETTSSYVLDLLAKQLDPKILFHNQRHTVQCVHAVQEITDAMQLSPSEKTSVQIAAWFLNVGYIQKDGDPMECALEQFEEFSDLYELDAANSDLVKSCLSNVKYPKDNQSPAEGVLHDAYWYFLSASNHIEMCDRLRREWSHQDKLYDDLSWRDFVCDLYKQPRYFTSYGRTVLEKRKQVNYYMCLTRLYGVAL